MFASIRRYRTDPDSTAEIAQQAKESFLPLLQKLPGFVAYYVVDGGGGVMTSISLFDSKDSADASNRQAADWAAEHLAQLVPLPPDTTAGEVVVRS